MLHFRASVLPGGQWDELWVADGRISRRPVPGARTVVTDGWLLPALVDSHLHIGVAEVGGPLSTEVLDRDLALLARSGVGAVRVLGSPEPLPEAVLNRPDGPLVQTAGTCGWSGPPC